MGMAGGKRGRPKGSKNSFRLGDLKGSYYETTTLTRKCAFTASGDQEFRIFLEPTPPSELTKNDVVMTADGKLATFIGTFQEDKFANVTFDGYKCYTYDSRAIKKKKPKVKGE